MVDWLECSYSHIKVFFVVAPLVFGGFLVRNYCAGCACTLRAKEGVFEATFDSMPLSSNNGVRMDLTANQLCAAHPCWGILTHFQVEKCWNLAGKSCSSFRTLVSQLMLHWQFEAEHGGVFTSWK